MTSNSLLLRISFSFVWILSTCLPPALSSGSTNSSVAPAQIYHQAWDLVRQKYHDPGKVGQSWAAWEHKFDGKLTSSKVAFDAVGQMLKSLNDPYTRLLEPEEFEQETSLLDSRMVGIGIYLEQESGKKNLTVSETIEGSPAEAAGIKAGDQIVTLDGKTVGGYSADQARKAIVGEPGSQVVVGLSRDKKLITLKITRRELVIPSVSTKSLPANLGYIRISSFMGDDTARQFRQALSIHQDKDGLVLDLRRNPGGQMVEALKIADMLLDQGAVIVRTIERNDKSLDVANGGLLTRQPLIVLVDKDSASASEILAAALKDHGRAAIIGTRTFGKGLVQQIEPLKGGGALHITVARFMSPRGAEINKVGVVPNMEVANRDGQLDMAVNLLSQKIAKHKAPSLTTSGPLEKKRT